VISRDELDQVASDLDLSIANVERDYVFGWLISGLFQASTLADSVVLKGGNALRKGYFPLTRFSDDLDFSTASGIDRTNLLSQLNEVCRFVGARTGVRFDLDRNKIADEQQIDGDRRVYKVRLYFQDFAGIGRELSLKVRMDLTEADRLYLPSQTRRLIHQYSDAAHCAADIRVVKLEEALADKLKCLIQRRYCYDLFDTVYAIFISNELAVDRGEIVRVFLKKTVFEPSPGAAKNLLLGLPFELFRAYWQKVICPVATRMSFDSAVETLLAGIEALFAPFGYGQQFAHAFFPAHLRNPILEAGSDRKLLQLRYHGVTRLVEPYSLTFKRTQTNGAREYFYAWDRTGGSSGVPGIRSFVSTDVEALSLTDQDFQPRFSIELSKSGDAAAAGYFTGSPGPRGPRVSTGRRTARNRQIYKVQCSYCGKIFRRTRPSTQLNEHKDNYGNRCYGRVGYRV
jgi:predicted nucleotidyltransferase component of viral defense system